MNNIFKVHHKVKQNLTNEIKSRFPQLDSMQVINLLDAFAKGNTFVLDWFNDNVIMINERDELKEEIEELKDDIKFLKEDIAEYEKEDCPDCNKLKDVLNRIKTICEEK